MGVRTLRTNSSTPRVQTIMKSTCVFIGSRANYSSCYPIMKAIDRHPDLNLQIMLGASALIDRFGNLEELIEKDGFSVSQKAFTLIEGNSPISMAKSTGLGIIEASSALATMEPDFVLVVGDRFDVMAPALSASLMNIPLAHTMGGEVSGTIDESIRHAITKLAHIHFPANEDARTRIIKLGENPDFVFNVGCPRIDLASLVASSDRPISAAELSELSDLGVGSQLNISDSKFLLVAQHPVTTEYGSNREQIMVTLEAINTFKLPTIMLWPNADSDSDEMSRAIRIFREQNDPSWLHLYKNLPASLYLRLMKTCGCIIGNSSSAIREGAFLGTPAVNIGSRQNSRLSHTNVVNVAPELIAVTEAISFQLNHGAYASSNLYGDGGSGPRIAETLANTNTISVQKTIQY